MANVPFGAREKQQTLANVDPFIIIKIFKGTSEVICTVVGTEATVKRCQELVKDFPDSTFRAYKPIYEISAKVEYKYTERGIT